MYRTMISLVVALMIYGTAMAADPVSTGSKDKEPSATLEQKVEEKVEAAKENVEKAKEKVKRFVRRLPNYFKEVVTEEQKTKIYAIQEEYAPKIAEYREKLANAIKEQNEKIHAVLTPEQKQKIEELQEAARVKRKVKSEEDTDKSEE